MTDSIIGDLAYFFRVIRSIILGAGAILTTTAVVDGVASGFEVMKCRQLDSTEVAGAVAMGTFLNSILLCTATCWLWQCCSDREREERERGIGSRDPQLPGRDVIGPCI